MPLTARKVETASPGKHGDGRGLMLVVKASGAKSWVLRYQINGRRRDLGLGAYPDVSLARARERALEARQLIAEGRDPLNEKNKRKELIFTDAATALIESKRSGWRNAKHAAQWRSTLESYAFPVLGKLAVQAIETEDVLAALRPIWEVKPETASRLRQRIEAVLDYATVLGARSGENPARWRGHLDHLLPRPGKVRAVAHFAALDWREIGGFMRDLTAREGVAPRALRFAILTAARAGEVRLASWQEIDLQAKVWTIPAARMKAGKEHRVPLSEAAMAALGTAGAQTELIFGSEIKPGRPLSDMSMTALLRRMGRERITVHGFRSTFRDWAGETTRFPREVIEMALAHQLKDKAEAAYARGDLFTKRRALMDDWSAWCSVS
ncbi:MAG: integrase arm-type DNA-binding domain-containing protein [Neomegalonema sp.]|nr:integrase arm-type DNA-binding domain-containing protein [Neomegalonema sp.]